MKRVCKLSGIEFELKDFEINFYNQFDLPLPDLCPNERRRQRLVFRNESSIYHRKCDGTNKQIISMYKPESKITVYDNDYWWSDEWDGLDYGLEYNLNKTFFEQFKELLIRVPKMARIQQGNNENSRYTNCASNNKNCYLIFSSNQNQDSLYARALNKSQNCIDTFAVTDSELCYNCSHCLRCYNLQFSHNCQGCFDSYYLKNCHGCKNCFGCYNLINKQYYFFNKKLNKEEYFKELAKLKLASYEFREKLEEFLNKHFTNVLIPEIYGYQNENISGNYIYNSRNIIDSFYIRDCEDIAYCDDVNNIKNSIDISFYGATGDNQNLYQGEGLGHNVQNVFCSKLIWGGSNNVYYSYECFNCSDIFGCCGLRKKQFCIFNKQYSETDYYKLKNNIISRMKESKEWGAFFPISLSPFCYNETVANDFFPLNAESALKIGAGWKEHSSVNLKQTSFSDLIPEQYSKEPLSSLVSGREFRIDEMEYRYLKEHHLPIPRSTPDERFLKNSSRDRLTTLNHKKCFKCSKAVMSYNDGNIICSECYYKEF